MTCPCTARSAHSSTAGRPLPEELADDLAQLVVLAARAGMPSVPGTVSQYVLLKARCPVTIVPDESTEEKASSGDS